MKIEVGKYYRTRDGRKVGPVGWDIGRSVFYDGQMFYLSCGLAWDRPRSEDLIAEWTYTPKVGKLAEIGAQVGDMVEWVSASETLYFARKHEGKMHTIQDDGRVLLNGGDGSYWGYLSDTDDFVNWRIISRAKPAGPVITETVKRIVPGVYGKVRISAAFPDEGVAYVGIIPCEEEQGRCYGLNRAELIAARDVFNQLIDALADSSVT